MLVKSYHRNNKPVGCAKKVDILKAYDSYEWDFVLAAMLSFFIFWTKVCLTTTFLRNGCLTTLNTLLQSIEH